MVQQHRYKCIELYVVPKTQNLRSSGINSTKPTQRVTYLQLSDSQSLTMKTKLNLCMMEKVIDEANITRNSITHIPQPTMFNKCHGYHPGVCNRALSRPKCEGQLNSLSYIPRLSLVQTVKAATLSTIKVAHTIKYIRCNDNACPGRQVFCRLPKQPWNTSSIVNQQKLKPVITSVICVQEIPAQVTNHARV